LPTATGNTIRGSNVIGITVGLQNLAVGSIVTVSDGFGNPTNEYDIVEIDGNSVAIVDHFSGALGNVMFSAMNATITVRPRGIHIGSGSRSNVVAANIFKFAKDAGVPIEDVDGQNIIYGNSGLVTQVSGEVDIAGDGSASTVAFEHGLVEDLSPSTEMIFTITPCSEKMAEATYWISSVTNTHVTISFSAPLENGEHYRFFIEGRFQDKGDGAGVSSKYE
jgi:hypothetical protein